MRKQGLKKISLSKETLRLLAGIEIRTVAGGVVADSRDCGGSGSCAGPACSMPCSGT
jgi:hypothetical protein